MAPSRGRKWQTTEGHALIRKIVKEKIPQWTGGLHDWQVIVVAWILDGEDVLCITATGDGKSAIFAVPIIILLELARNPTAYPRFANQKKPVGLVIAPTKGLSTNIVYELQALGVPALAFTSETLTEARKAGRDLTAEIVECRWAIVCVDPEHLTDKQWESITDAVMFRENLAFLCVDEGHLIDEWGAEFRPSFRHIGPFARARLPPHISVFALTATLQPGASTKSICRNLGFRRDMFHLYRRSNERTNVQFLLVPLTHGLGKQRLRRIRLYHAMCWPDENEETVRLIRDDPLCQVVVATVAFGQGFNIKTLLDSVSLGVPKTVAQTLQQGGRVGRDPSTTGRAVVLAQASAYTAAGKYLKARASSTSNPTSKKQSKSLTTMNNEKALMLTTKQCLHVFFNRLYGNDTPGALLDCIALPRRLPCSNCLPRFVGPLYLPTPPGSLVPFSTPLTATSSAPSRPTKNQKLTKKMRSTAELELRKFRDRVYSLERDNEPHGYTPASSYLSTPIITTLLDNFLHISSTGKLSATIPRWKHHSRHGSPLLAIITNLQQEFTAQFEAARIERNKKNLARTKSKRAAALSDSEGEAEDVEMPEECNGLHRAASPSGHWTIQQMLPRAPNGRL
ncbi:P-loop containing nucleoside triphosphate hydrolase protein [Mycena polygramma]|nr:P-loop containing nucleoside triphosphate hydrolase protein [Mycena polygramma]KAJ7602747.1 P-loop containing nucleoside triphosphate hydrolase protein [Mycena polygramma]